MLPRRTKSKAAEAPEVGHLALLQALASFHPLEEEAADYLLRHLKKMKVRKKKLLLREGAFCEYVYFIYKGAARGFINEGVKDITTWITVENEMITSIASLDVQAPSRENIQVIEDSELFALHYDHLNALYEQFPSFNSMGRKLLQRYYGDAERRAFIARLTNAETKYRHFLDRYQDLVNRIPLKYIASFLGITIETLSRVRKKLSEGS